MNLYGKRPQGMLRVTQATGNAPFVRDFDNEEWSYLWHSIQDHMVLRLHHDRDPEATISFYYIDFSAPVSVEFIREY